MNTAELRSTGFLLVIAGSFSFCMLTFIFSFMVFEPSTRAPIYNWQLFNDIFQVISVYRWYFFCGGIASFILGVWYILRAEPSFFGAPSALE